MVVTLTELCDLISSSVADVYTRCSALSCKYPSPDDPDTARLLEDSEVYRATAIALAARGIAAHRNHAIYPSRTIIDASFAVRALILLTATSKSDIAQVPSFCRVGGCYCVFYRRNPT